MIFSGPFFPGEGVYLFDTLIHMLVETDVCTFQAKVGVQTV